VEVRGIEVSQGLDEDLSSSSGQEKGTMFEQGWKWTHLLLTQAMCAIELGRMASNWGELARDSGGDNASGIKAVHSGSAGGMGYRASRPGLPAPMPPEVRPENARHESFSGGHKMQACWVRQSRLWRQKQIGEHEIVGG